MRFSGDVHLPIAFGVFGVLWGGWQALLPDLAAHYGLSTGPLGLILTAGFAVSLPTMIASGRLLDRIGARWGIAIPALAMAVGVGSIGALPPIAGLVGAVIVFAAASGAYDVAINGAAMGHPRWSGSVRLTLLHAAFSGGGMLGALAGGALVAAGMAFELVYVALAACIAVTGALAWSGAWPVASSAASVPRGLAVTMLPLAAVAALAFLIEGSMETWSAIYLRGVLGAPPFIGALGPAAFHAAMLVGRLSGAAVAGWFGPAATLLLAGSMTFLGMAVALGVPLSAAAIPGMVIAALGASFVVPVVASLAAGRAGRHAGRAASYVLTLGYAGFLVGPSLVGVGGELIGLRGALLVVPAAAVVIALVSRTSASR